MDAAAWWWRWLPTEWRSPCRKRLAAFYQNEKAVKEAYPKATELNGNRSPDAGKHRGVGVG